MRLKYKKEELHQAIPQLMVPAVGIELTTP